MMDKEMLRREFSITAEKADGEPSRVVDLCFATDAPVERMMNGERVLEVLEISPESLNLERLNAGGPLLLEHNQQIGGIVKAWIGDDRKARARVKFSRSRVATDVMDDVADDIRRCVSVGYHVDEWKRETTGDAVTMRATKWTAHEVSIVSMPADIRAGVGRSMENLGGGETSNKQTETMETKAEKIEVRTSDPVEIAALGRKHNLANDAADFIARGATLDEFKSHVIERQAVRPVVTEARSRVADGYSFGALIRALAEGRSAPERESLEHDRLTRLAGRGGAGFWVPNETFQRAVTTASSPAYIGTTVGETIPALNADSLAVRLGAKVVSGLTGKVTFPRSGKSTAAFLAETATAEESNPDAEALTLDAKRLCAVVKVSKRLLAQSSPDIEAIIKSDIVTQLSLALDRAIFNGAGGVSPTGIVNTAGVGSVAGAASRATAVSLESSVSGADALGSAMAYVMTPAVAATLKSEQLGTSGRFAIEDKTLIGYAAHASTQVPTGQLIFGDWSQVVIAVFGSGIEVSVDTSSGAASGLVSIVANQYVDAGLRHAESFAKLA